MTKATHLREMSTDQLHFTLTESQKELFRLRFQAATEKLDAPSNLRKLRRKSPASTPSRASVKRRRHKRQRHILPRQRKNPE
jgi:large subunit ribosomal protein L29